MAILGIVGFFHQPPLPDESEFVLLSEGFSDKELESLQSDDLPVEYAVFLLWCTASETNGLEEAAVFCQELTPGPRIEVVCISEDPTLLVRRHRRIAKRLQPGYGAVHQNAVAFNRASSAARDSAVAVIRSTVLRKPWQFWR